MNKRANIESDDGAMLPSDLYLGSLIGDTTDSSLPTGRYRKIKKQNRQMRGKQILYRSLDIGRRCRLSQPDQHQAASRSSMTQNFNATSLTSKGNFFHQIKHLFFLSDALIEISSLPMAQRGPWP